ncbi:MAG: thermonuclease family protein [Bacillota bacterium]
MLRKLGTLLALLILVSVALYLSAGRNPGAAPKAPAGGVRAWKTPSEADLERLKGEKGMRASQPALKKMRPATVVRVVDGDTVELDLGGKAEKVRLLNVNTPETVDPRKPVEEYGREASAFARSVLTPGLKVYVKPDVEERDRYGRLLLHLYLEDGTWFNALLIRAGYAQLMTISPNVSAAGFFRELQARARKEEIGLWQIEAYRNPPKK